MSINQFSSGQSACFNLIISFLPVTSVGFSFTLRPCNASCLTPSVFVNVTRVIIDHDDADVCRRSVCVLSAPAAEKLPDPTMNQKHLQITLTLVSG